MLLSEEAFLTHFLEQKKNLKELQKAEAARQAKLEEENMTMTLEEIFAKPLFSNI